MVRNVAPWLSGGEGGGRMPFCYNLPTLRLPTWQQLGHEDSSVSLASPVTRGCGRYKILIVAGPVQQSQVGSLGQLPHWWAGWHRTADTTCCRRPTRPSSLTQAQGSWHIACLLWEGAGLFSHLTLTTTLCSVYYYYAHFADEKIEAQRA